MGGRSPTCSTRAARAPPGDGEVGPASPRLLVTQNDVRAIQLAKAALYAGARLLMDHLGVETVDQVKLAGAFGSQIDPLHAMVLGLVPDAPLDRVGAAGNAAGTGALIALLSGEARREIERVVRTVEKIETAVEPRFQEHFVDAMAFPHAPRPLANLATRGRACPHGPAATVARPRVPVGAAPPRLDPRTVVARRSLAYDQDADDGLDQFPVTYARGAWYRPLDPQIGITLRTACVIGDSRGVDEPRPRWELGASRSDRAAGRAASRHFGDLGLTEHSYDAPHAYVNERKAPGGTQIDRHAA